MVTQSKSRMTMTDRRKYSLQAIDHAHTSGDSVEIRIRKTLILLPPQCNPSKTNQQPETLYLASRSVIRIEQHTLKALYHPNASGTLPDVWITCSTYSASLNDSVSKAVSAEEAIV